MSQIPAEARLADEVLGLEMEMRPLEVCGVVTLGDTFDLILFLGVLCQLHQR
jgi:hypothetical protein